MKKNVNWSYMAGLFDSRGVIEYVLASPKGKNDGRMIPVIQHEDQLLMKHLISNLGGVYYESPTPDGDEVYEWRPKGSKNRVRFATAILPYTLLWSKELKELLECESVETNTLCTETTPVKIESELTGDSKSAQEVTPVA